MVLDNIESFKESLEEGGCDAVVWGRGECQDIDLGMGEGESNGAANIFAVSRYGE